ncbi:MAG TPA: hypothetical protein VEI46_01180 [Thermodesulfovibrionales bacterium]|nr:hypothetical protein [Thermodesulfovibrionales bacterium]
MNKEVLQYTKGLLQCGYGNETILKVVKVKYPEVRLDEIDEMIHNIPSLNKTKDA